MNLRSSFLIAFLLLLSIQTVSFGQSTTGRLVGVISSPDGVLPNATVTAKDNKTGKELTVVTGGDGTFAIPQLEFGTYTVTVSNAGFKTLVANEVKIDVGREYTLTRTLEVGNVSESVTVTAGAELLNSSNAELSNTVSSRQIQDLPLNGRNPLGLITLQPGTAANGAQGTSINGQRPSAPNITLDGLNIQDNFVRANASSFTQITPSTDDVSEFTVTTQNAGADQGNGTAQIQLVTPRGQSSFHGSLYEYNRNSKFGANDFFNNSSGVEQGFQNYNQFGGKLSGPLPLPHFGEGGPAILKNKAFFFVNYEELRNIQPAPTTRTVLTDTARTGIFRYIDNAGVRQSVNLFAIGTTGTNVPTGINPLIQSRFLANIPRGNSTNAGDQLNTTGYDFTQKTTTNNRQIKMRFDVDINDRNTFNIVAFRAKGKGLQADFGDANGFSETPTAGFSNDDKFIVGAYRTTPSANFSNEIRVGYTTSFPSFPRTDPNPVNFFVLPLVTNPETTFLFQGRQTRTYTYQDNANYSAGNHSVRFGVEYNVIRALRLNDGGILPSYTLGTNTNTPTIATAQFTNTALFPGGIGTTARGQANALYSLLGGIVTTEAQTFNVTSATSGFVPLSGFRQDYAYENFGSYVADQWRIRPNFTVNLGLRYELWFPVRERNGVISEVAIPKGTDPTAALRNPNGSVQIVGGNAGKQRLFNLDKNNFAPNVSFAYNPDFKSGLLSSLFPGNGKTVLRAGFRISYYNDEFLKAPSGEGDQNPGLRLNTQRSNLNERADAPGSNAVPAVLIPRTFADLKQNVSLQQSLITVDPNIKVPSNYEYNLSFQREIGWNTAIEVRYVGAFSNNATRESNKNQIDINNDGFLADYLRAQNNCRLQGAIINPAATNPLLACTNASYNPAIAGSQPLTVFANLGTIAGVGAGGLANTTGSTNATILGLIQAGTPGQLAVTYIANGADGTVPFRANPNLLLTGLLDNSGKYLYNGLQVELRRRFTHGLYFQANYTFQKTLTNSPGVDQRRQEFELDATRPQLEYGRAQYDQTHVFNLNGIYELPFGKGRRFLSNSGGVLDTILGGWQLNGIVRLASGSPFGIFDPRGTLNYNTQSARNPANSNLTKADIKKLVGIFKTPKGIYFIDPKVIDPVTGRAANGYGQPTFAGQVFFNVEPGQIGNVERFFLNGPLYFNVDASLFKNIRISESTRFQIRAEAFNLFNRTNFALTAGQQLQSVNASTFGRLGVDFAPRVIQFAARFEF
ncbi:MAG: TonB-dependent receptor [Acidobacteriota bacterium]